MSAKDNVEILTLDPWEKLRLHTDARIALGRSGNSLPTTRALEFAFAHASARDAVHIAFDVDRLRDELAKSGLENIVVSSRAVTRQTYLARPDLGRRLAVLRDNQDETSHPDRRAIGRGGC